VGTVLLLSFLLGLAAFLGGLSLVVVRALEVWRATRSLQRKLTRGIGDVLTKAAGVETRVSKAADTAGELQAALARLQKSRRTLGILSAAWGDSSSLFGALGAAYPRK
jgi:hypothetical protein